MDISNLILFLLMLLLVVKSADSAMKYAARFAKMFHISEFIVSFFIVALISTLPEGSIAIISAIKGVSDFGMGALIGSNVADLALVFGLAALVSTTRGVYVRSRILKKDLFFLALLLFPVLLGLDGRFSRVEGVLLVLSGLLFFFTLSIEARMFRRKANHLLHPHIIKNFVWLIFSLAVLLASANYAIKFGIIFANEINIPPIIIGLTVISIGSCLPELFFSMRAVKHKHDELALGDVLGTVVTDATIWLGIITIINPFSFDPIIMYITGSAMFIAGLLTIIFITTGKVLTRKEGIFLLIFYILYLIVEVIVNRII